MCGIGEACRLAKEDLEYDYNNVEALSNKLLKDKIEHIYLNGDEKHEISRKLKHIH